MRFSFHRIRIAKKATAQQRIEFDTVKCPFMIDFLLQGNFMLQNYFQFVAAKALTAAAVAVT